MRVRWVYFSSKRYSIFPIYHLHANPKQNKQNPIKATT